MQSQAPGGYNGRIVRVNLSNGTVSTESIDEEFCRLFLGGAGFIAHVLLDEVESVTDPLSPENKLVFATGPLTGGALPGTGRHCIGAKSPLTDGVAKSEVGEFWGRELKRAGFDAIIIEGKAPKPVYLWINKGEVKIRDAVHLWGRHTKETQESIRAELGDNRIRTALIGPAGESLVRYACILHGLYDVAGRGGMGAVMGSKRLKAIAVRGDKSPRISNPSGVKALSQWLKDNWKLVANLSAVGTGGGMSLFEQLGNLPTRNFRDGAFPEVKKIDAHALKDAMGAGMHGCFGCPVRCKKAINSGGPYEIDSSYGGPEYETLAVLGSNCGIDDLQAIVKANQLCNAYGLDTLSTGGTIAFAMECFEKGLLTSQDTKGIKLNFGNAEAMIQLIELIGKRQGIGNLLAEGSARAAREIGGGAEDLSMQVKRLEIPMHEPRLNKSAGLGYMVNPHGADHCCNMVDIFLSGFGNEPNVTLKDALPLGMAPAPFASIGPRKVALFRIYQLSRIVQDSLLICMFLPYSYQQMAKVTGATAGWNTTPMEQLRVAERILTMFRLFNHRQGLTADDDRLPSRFFQPTRYGALADTALNPEEMDQAKRYYYALMGWDFNGVPSPEKLEELGIDH